MFVTLVYGILDCCSGNFHFARAAHPVPYLLDGRGQKVAVPISHAQPLGLFDTPPIDEQSIHLSPGGVILLYSDGVTETVNPKGDEFGLESLNHTMRVNRRLPPQDLCDKLWQNVKSHGGDAAQQDDFTTVVIKRKLHG